MAMLRTGRLGGTQSSIALGRPSEYSNSNLAAATSPAFAAPNIDLTTSCKSHGAMAASNALRSFATRRACGLPGPPGLPGANRPPASRPLYPFEDRARIMTRPHR